MFQYRKFGYVESSSLSFVFAYSTTSLYICTGMFLVFRRNMNCSMTKSRILYRFVQSDTRETKRITISSASAVVKFSWSRSLPPNCNIAWCGRNSSIFASRRCRCDALFTQPPLIPYVLHPMWIVQIETLQAVFTKISLQMVHVRASQKQGSHCLFVYALSDDVVHNIPIDDKSNETSQIM